MPQRKRAGSVKCPLGSPTHLQRSNGPSIQSLLGSPAWITSRHHRVLSTLQEHLRHVAEILRALCAAGLSLKLKKCAFFDSSVNYLGHVIRHGRLEVANRNTDAIQGFIVPTSETELPSLIGLCNVTGGSFTTSSELPRP